MRGRTEISAETDELLDFAIDFITRVGERAEAQSRRGLGIPLPVLRGHIERVLGSLTEIRTAGLADVPGADLLFDVLRTLRAEAPATFRKTLGRIAGICLIPQGFRAAMRGEGERRAFVANALYECEQDLLDDLIDEGGYTFGEARRLYNLCLRPITGRGRTNHLEEALTDLMAPGQEGLATLLAALTKEIRGLVLETSDTEVLRRLEEAHERLATAQAASVFLIRGTFDLGRLAEVGSTLPAPDPAMSWLDRMAVFASWTSNLALLDACFTETSIPPAQLDAHERAWLYLNAVVSYLEHFANAAPDLREGIINLPMITTHGTGGIQTTARLSSQERDALFARASECLAAAIGAGDGRGDASSYYAFMSLMIPAAIFTLCRTPNDEADAFFETLADTTSRSPDNHSATYSETPLQFRIRALASPS